MQRKEQNEIMRESIHKYFQVGTIRWMSFPKMGVVESVKRIASDDYFDAVEISQCKDCQTAAGS